MTVVKLAKFDCIKAAVVLHPGPITEEEINGKFQRFYFLFWKVFFLDLWLILRYFRGEMSDCLIRSWDRQVYFTGAPKTLGGNIIKENWGKKFKPTFTSIHATCTKLVAEVGLQNSIYTSHFKNIFLNHLKSKTKILPTFVLSTIFVKLFCTTRLIVTWMTLLSQVLILSLSLHLFMVLVHDFFLTGFFLS